MPDPQVVLREDWFVARRQLLAREKELTRHRDEVNAELGAGCRWSRSTRSTSSAGPSATTSMSRWIPPSRPSKTTTRRRIPGGPAQRVAARGSWHQRVPAGGNRVFHAYSTYVRGGDLLLGTYNWLDLTALGQQEDWPQPPGRSDGPALSWLRREHQLHRQRPPGHGHPQEP